MRLLSLHLPCGLAVTQPSASDYPSEEPAAAPPASSVPVDQVSYYGPTGCASLLAVLACEMPMGDGFIITGMILQVGMAAAGDNGDGGDSGIGVVTRYMLSFSCMSFALVPANRPASC